LCNRGETVARPDRRLAPPDQRAASPDERTALPDEPFAPAWRTFAAADQRFASVDQIFASPDQKFASPVARNWWVGPGVRSMQAKVSSRVTEKRPVSSWSSVPRGKNLLQTACSWLLADKFLRRPTNAQLLGGCDLPRRTKLLVRRTKLLVRRSKSLVRRSAKLVGGNQTPGPEQQILPAPKQRRRRRWLEIRPIHQLPAHF